MVAEVTQQMVPKWTAKCDECGVWLASSFRPGRDYLQANVDLHNRYCHSDEPLSHAIVRTYPKLIGYTVQCICGATSASETSNLSGWRCYLDRTAIPA